MPIIFLLYLELVTAIFNGTPEKNFLRSISKWYSDNHKQGATDNLSLKASLKRDSLRSSQAQNIDISQDLGPSPKPSAILTLHITTGHRQLQRELFGCMQEFLLERLFKLIAHWRLICSFPLENQDCST